MKLIMMMVKSVRGIGAKGIRYSGLFGILCLFSIVGLHGQALDFDGVNDYASSSGSLANNSNFTLEAWVKPRSFSSYNWVIQVGDVAIGASNNGNLTYLIDGSTSGSTSTQAISLNVWSHIALVYNSSWTNKYKLYLNGSELATTPQFSYAGKSPDNLTGFYFSRSGGYEGWVGGIDEVRIWNVDRTSAEISANYNNVLANPGSLSGLKGYYKMNEGVPGGNNSGISQLIDASGNNNNATISNFALAGNVSNYISDALGTGSSAVEVFSYIGNVQAFIVPTSGNYKLEVWGAQGGNDVSSPSTLFGGRGGYSCGELYLTAGTTLYVYVGGQGTGCNSSTHWSSGGGGATDIRLVGGAWDNNSGLYSRILVAGGGGGRHGNNYEVPGGAYVGNDGGGSSSLSFTTNGYTISGSTDQNGGTSTYSSSVVPGSFGFATPNSQSNTCSAGGWNGGARGSDNWANGGAGGGWYGGCTSWPTSAGGSGYVLTTLSHKPAGYTPGVAYYMTNTNLIAGNAVMPDPTGGTVTGRSGNGYARITRLDCSNPSNGGTISTDQSVCIGVTPAMLTQSAAPSGSSNGNLEYKWQWSTTSSAAGFGDIADATSSNYQPGPLTHTTWFKRLLKVDCESNWLESNVIEITVNPLLQYRSKAGLDYTSPRNWTTAANWEQYNGSSWVAATSYPGEISNACSSPLVTILAGHQMEISGVNITLPNLKVEGTGMLFVRSTAKLYVNGQLQLDQNSAGAIVVE